MKEAYCIAGRRSGKSTIAALIACYVAGFTNWETKLSPGERAVLFIIATDKDQARIIRDYVMAFLNGSPNLRNLIGKAGAEMIELRNQAVIQVKAASYRATRGFTLALVIAEELSFWRDVESGANPAAEILRSVRPSLQASGGLLLGISSPHSRSGVLFEQYRDHFGHVGDTLIWRAASKMMNPTLDPEMIARAIELDPEAGKSEWLAEWRTDVSTFLDLVLIESAVIPGRLTLPPMEGKYHAFTDPSGGRVDSFCLGVSHFDIKNGRAVLDLAVEKRPPLNPNTVAEEFSLILKGYGLNHVAGDAYAASWCSGSFQKNGVLYIPSERTASEIFLSFMPMLASGQVELLDLPRLKGQLGSLERRTRPGGRDTVGHPPGLHDDLAVCAAGSLLLAGAGQKRKGTVSFTGQPEKPKPPAPGPTPTRIAGPGRLGKVSVSKGPGEPRKRPLGMSPEEYEKFARGREAARKRRLNQDDDNDDWPVKIT